MTVSPTAALIGKCTVRFHDTDMYIATHPDDYVALPPEAAIAMADTRC